MRVLVAIDKLSVEGMQPSCIAMAFAELHPRLAERGIDMQVCNIRGENDPGARLLADKGVPTINLGRSPLDPRIANDIRRLSADADIVHCHGYAAANFGRLGAPVHTPVIVHEHAILKLRPHQWLADLALRRHTTLALGVSKAVCEFLIRGRHVPRERVRVLYNGVDTHRFQPLPLAAARADARHALGLPVDRRLIGTVGRLRAEKGFHILIQAFTAIAEKHPTTDLFMIGSGDQQPELEALAQRLGIASRITFVGFRNDVARLYPVFDLLAIPSLSEGFSFTAVEALASGCPVVASRTGGLAEILEDGQQALHVKPGDPDELGAAIARLLDDPVLEERLRHKGPPHAKQFGLEPHVDRLAAIYRELAPIDGEQER